MPIEQSRVGNKISNDANPDKALIPAKLGIYKAEVKKIDTSTRSGRVWVYSSDFGGSDPSNSDNWKLMNYASPYSGSTLGQAEPAKNQLNSFYTTKQTYGFFMTPPDVGQWVLCCYPGGDSQEGYWFACISPDILSRNMTPAIGSVPFSQIDPVSIPSGIAPFLNTNYNYPVSEFNQLDPKAASANWNTLLKPLHIPQASILVKQGLDSDLNRGPITSSVQRDPVSTVFGFSTPGRPYGGQDPANNPDLSAILSTGDFNISDFDVTTRVGGHSLVMDDGDIYGKSNLTRLRTGGGHQIMMNDSAGIIYISNSAGSAWVELNNSGDILIYAANDLAIRAQGNLLMQSDHNINFQAGLNINMAAQVQIASQAPIIQNNASRALVQYGAQATLNSSSGMKISTGGSMKIHSSGGMSIDGATIALNGGGGGGGSVPSKFATYNLPEAVISGGRWQIQPNGFVSINYKVPTHEPYIRGNINAVIAQQTAALNANISTGSSTISNSITPGPNYASAITRPVVNPAPTSTFIAQLTPSSILGNLTLNSVRALNAQLGFSTSGSNYKLDPNGYLGKYQMGSIALQSLGYVKSGTPQTETDMTNSSNWTGLNGIGSSDDFLNNPSIQEQAMASYTSANYSALEAMGLITSATVTDNVAGFLAAAHVTDPQSVFDWYTGNATNDAVTTAFNQGRYSQTQLPTLLASDQSKV